MAKVKSLVERRARVRFEEASKALAQAVDPRGQEYRQAKAEYLAAFRAWAETFVDAERRAVAVRELEALQAVQESEAD